VGLTHFLTAAHFWSLVSDLYTQNKEVTRKPSKAEKTELKKKLQNTFNYMCRKFREIEEIREFMPEAHWNDTANQIVLPPAKWTELIKSNKNYAVHRTTGTPYYKHMFTILNEDVNRAKGVSVAD
jgi:hypothetical protein